MLLDEAFLDKLERYLDFVYVIPLKKKVNKIKANLSDKFNREI